MKKKRLFLVIILFLLPSVSALYQKELYSGTVYPGQNVNISNKTFTFNLGSITDKINVVTPSGGIIVKQGACEVKDFFNICFEGTEFWYQNYTLDKMYYKAKVSVSEILPKIELTRTIENKDLTIGEETNIDVIFKNAGDRDADDIIYKDDFPPEFIIASVTNCRSEGNGIRWNGALTTSLEKRCSYKIRAINKITFSSAAMLQYSYGEKTESVNSTIDKIKVSDYQLNISTYLADDDLSVGEETNFTITLKNNNPEKNIQIENFEISMPIGIKVPYVVYGMKQDFNKFRWKGTLTQEDSSVSFFFELKAEQPKDYSLITNAAFLLNNIRGEISTLDKLKVRKIGEETEKIEEEPVSYVNLSEESYKEEVMVETVTTTTTIPITQENASEEKEEKLTIEKESTVKKLFNNAFFIIIDAIIISLIIIIIMKIVKQKKQNY